MNSMGNFMIDNSDPNPFYVNEDVGKVQFWGDLDKSVIVQQPSTSRASSNASWSTKMVDPYSAKVIADALEKEVRSVIENNSDKPNNNDILKFSSPVMSPVLKHASFGTTTHHLDNQCLPSKHCIIA